MAGDNHKEQPEAGGQQPELPGEKITVLIIRIDKKTQRVEVEGALGNKVLCLNVLGEAIKTVANFNPSPIVVPHKGGIMNFARKVIGKG